MDSDYYKKIFGIATFVGGIYYLRFAILFAVEYRGLPPDYLRAILYLAISVMMFCLFKYRVKLIANRPIFWIFTIWGLYVLCDFVFRIFPAYL